MAPGCRRSETRASVGWRRNLQLCGELSFFSLIFFHASIRSGPVDVSHMLLR